MRNTGTPTSLRKKLDKTYTPWEVRYRRDPSEASRYGSRSFADKRAALAFQRVTAELGYAMSERLLAELRRGQLSTELGEIIGERGLSRQLNALCAAHVTPGFPRSVRGRGHPRTRQTSLANERDVTAHKQSMNLVQRSCALLPPSLSSHDLARLLGVSVRVIAELSRAGQLVGRRRGRSLVYDRERIMEFLSSQANARAVAPATAASANYTVRDSALLEDLPPFLAAGDAARELGVTAAHLMTLCRRDELAAAKVGKAWVIPRDALAVLPRHVVNG